jgi:beta-phosphoglucomutase-like phosphatase (HAD superfamily)/adenine/guanine phosphoribosyltransferase-like PRPP-binding protein
MTSKTIPPLRRPGFSCQVPMRVPYDNVSTTSITSAVVCAEKPNIKLVEATLHAIAKSAPGKLNTIVADIARLSTVFERERFERQLIANLSLCERAAYHEWSPDHDLTTALSENRLQSNVETALAKGWLANYVIQVKSLRHAHLRLIAKKGCDLHGNRHFASQRLPESDPNTIGRRAAADEILEPMDWLAHAGDLLGDAETSIRKSAGNGNATIVIADYVKDWTQAKNSFNVFSRSYTKYLVQALKTVARHKFKDLKISVAVLPIRTLTTTDRTNATAIERLFRQPVLEESTNFDGMCVILVDDHINTGACLAAMHSVVRKSGGRIVGISTYSRHEGMTSLRASRDTLALFDGIASAAQINDALSDVGVQFDTLTPREALTLAATLLDGRKKEQIDRFHAINGANTLHDERPIMPGISDSIEELLLGAPRGIEAIKAAAAECLRETRYMFRPILFDLDDTLIDSTEYYYNVHEYLFSVVQHRFGLPRPRLDYRQKGDQKSEAYFAQEYGQENIERIMAVREEILLGEEVIPTLLPGAEEILGYLHERQIPIGVVSNTPQNILEHILNSSLRKTGVDISVVVGNAGKPNPEGLIKALDLFEINGVDTGCALYIGDDPNRDGEAACGAGVEVIIVPKKKVAGRRQFTTLPSLGATLAFLKTRKLKATDIKSPPYIKRERRSHGPLENTEIITSEMWTTEAPIEGSLNVVAAFSLAQREFHNLRWIAKRGVNLRQEGPFSKEEQRIACDKVLHGFTASDGTRVEGLLKPLMIERLAEKVGRHIAGRWKKMAGENGDITIHLPARTVIPKKRIENELASATNHAIAQRLSAHFRVNPIPGQKITFCETDRVLIGETLQLVVDGEEKLEGTRICSLSEHDPDKTVQAGRTEGNGLSRVVRQPLFNYSTFHSGDAVILTDDCAQAGSTFITWDQALKRRGVNVVAYAALSSLPETRNLLATPEVIKEFDRVMAFAVSNHIERFPSSDPIKVADEFQRNLDHLLRVVGISRETLSNREALTIMAFFVDGTNDTQVEWFFNLAITAGADPKLPEREDESPFSQARRPFISPNELAVMIDREIPKYCVFRV